MKRNSDIAQELKEISPAVSAITNDTVFKAPPGYFDALPDRLLTMAKAQTAGTGLLPGEETNALSPLIASLKNKPVFSIPAGYFDTLPRSITEKLAASKKEAPVFQINPGFKSRKPIWLRYAAAAMVTGVIAVSALLLWNTTADNYSNPSLSATENNNPQPVATQLPGVSDIDLAGYLSTIPETQEWDWEDDADAEFTDFAFLKMDDSNLGNMLKDIPYEVLLNYEEDISDKESPL